MVDAQVSLELRVNGEATNGNPFLLALTAAVVPVSLYPSSILAVHGVLALHTTNVPTSVAEILALLIIANDLLKPPVTAKATEAVPNRLPVKLVAVTEPVT